MSTWNDLVSAALVGTERRAFAPDPAIAETDPARALLRQAMLLAIPTFTGAPPAPYQGSLPEAAPPDDRPLIPSAAQLRLRAVLDVYPKYLAEWLGAVRDAGCRLPLAAMPELLDAGRNNVPVRGVLAEVLGARGHWLARQNADWRYLLREPYGPLRPTDWDGPDPEARIAYANGLYATDPDAARALVQAAWPTQTAANKLNLLALVARHGTQADLAFIRTLSQDSSKQVRDEAKSVEAQLSRRAEEAVDLASDGLAAEIQRLAETEGFHGTLYRFASRRAGQPWPLDASRLLLALLVEFSRNRASDDQSRAGDTFSWAAQNLVGLIADCAPLELLPDVQRVVQAQAAGLAAGVEHRLDFGSLLTPLGFRADMHAELTASADAESGQE